MRSIYYRLYLIILIFCICTYSIGGIYFPEGKTLFFPNKQIKYGLDINGGSYIVLQIDKQYMMNDIISDLSTDVSSKLKKNSIEFRKINIKGNEIVVQFNNMKDVLSAFKLIQYNKNVDLKSDESCLYITMKRNYLNIFEKDIIKNLIENIRKRVDEIGTKDVLINTKDTDKIIIQIPSVTDPKQVREFIGKTAKLSFHFLADPKVNDINDIQKLYDKSGNEFYVFKHVELSGDTLKNATVSFNNNGNPIIVFKFNHKGSKILAKMTKDNIGNLLAIVFDNIILMTPKIREPIIGGRGEINGNFSLQEAEEMSILLRSGALPVPLNVIEERFVGATLGKDVINSSKIAIISSILFVSIIMVFFYGIFGIISIIALFFNMLIIITCIVLCGIIVTLPSIAGLILTIGMAVDNNILIYENIKDKLVNRKVGQNNIMLIIKNGFEESKTTILDSNITTLIAAVIMFFVGIGPIKGFSVVLSIGIFSSIFTAVNVTYVLTQTFYLLKYRMSQTR